MKPTPLTPALSRRTGEGEGTGQVLAQQPVLRAL